MSARECRDVSRRLGDLLDGRLPPSEEALARAHLAGCDRCQGEWAEFGELRDALAALPAPPLRSDALQRLHAASPRKSRAPSMYVSAICGVAVALVVVTIARRQLSSREATNGRVAQVAAPLAGASVAADAAAMPEPVPVRAGSDRGTRRGAPAAAPVSPRRSAHHLRPRRCAAKPDLPTRPSIVVAVSHPAGPFEPGAWPGDHAAHAPRCELLATTVRGGAEPEAQLVYGRALDEDLNVTRIMIAYRPLSEDPAGTLAEPASPAGEGTSDGIPEDTDAGDGRSTDDGSHTGAVVPAARLGASEA